jgi:hypothetical protein
MASYLIINKFIFWVRKRTIKANIVISERASSLYIILFYSSVLRKKKKMKWLAGTVLISLNIIDSYFHLIIQYSQLLLLLKDDDEGSIII